MVRANLPDWNYFVGKPIPGKPDILILSKVASGNDGILFKGYSQTLARDFACKVIPRANLRVDQEGKEIWRDEVRKADLLLNPAVVRFADVQAWQDNDNGIDCVVLISDFVAGPSLREFASKHSDEVNIPFVVLLLRTILNLFNEMQAKAIEHGDLHAGNILVEDRSSYHDLEGPRFAFRVTDFGVSDATSDARHKDDYSQLADILTQVLHGIDYGNCSSKDKFVFDTLRNQFAGRHLIEADPTRDPHTRNPSLLHKRLKDLDFDFESSVQRDSTSLNSPFDFLSCEQIGEAPELLHALYSDRFLGLDVIESKNNVVVTGPRGCGKSTVFRSLSLDQRLRVAEASPERISYLGVYYRCDDLYFAFPRYAAPARESLVDVPVHFLTSTLIIRLLDALEVWAKTFYADEFARLESRVAELLWAALEILPPKVPGNDTLKAIVARLQKERRRSIDWQRFANDPKRDPGFCFGADVLQRFCGILRSNISFLSGLPIYFLIDDYSAPKVTKALQANLNRILMQRGSYCFFKISTESPVSFEKRDIDGKSYVENREFALHNLGLVYLHASLEAKLSFIEDVFRRRLHASDYRVKSLEELLGSVANLNSNEVAREIRNKKSVPLYGKEAIANLCSGDIHYVISLVGSMVRLESETTDTNKGSKTSEVSPKNQNRAIREAAGAFLKNLRSIPKCGEHLVEIVEAFGRVAHLHLIEVDSKNYDNAPPKQATRIEPLETMSLTPEAQEYYNELLRYSVFIEDYRGKSRRGHIVPRLFLRRFLVPHFNLTFSTRDSIEIEPDQFNQFMLAPQEFERQQRRDIDKAKVIARDKQLPLAFPDENQ